MNTNILSQGMRAALAVSLLCAASLASALTYSANGGGGTGSSTIGAGGDYTSLKDAAYDFNNTVNTGSYTFFIISNLTEPANVQFGSPTTNTNTLTFKPGPAVTPTVTFTQITDNAGWSGHFIIGATGLGNLNDVVTTGVMNVIIDGSNTVGGTTRDLTFENIPAVGPVTATDFPVTVHLAGPTPNAVVKNVRIRNLASVPANSYHALRFSARLRGVAPVGPFIPNNPVVDNCFLECINGQAGHGLTFTQSGSPAAPNIITNAVVKNSTLIGETRGVLFNFNGAHTVNNCSLSVNQRVSTSALNSNSIIHAAANTATGWVATYTSNTITGESSTTSPASGLQLLNCGGAPAANGTEYLVANNQIIFPANPLNRTDAGTTDAIYNAVVSGSSFSTVTLLQNSINMPNDPSATGGTAGRVAAIAFTSTNVANNVNARNNVIRDDAGGTTASIIFKGNGIAPLGAENVYYQGAGVPNFVTLLAGGGAFPSLGAWKASGAGREAGSDNADPFVPSGTYTGVWTSPTNLHFTADPGPLYMGEAAVMARVPLDVDGQTRVRPVAGFDEVPATPTAYVNSWSLY